ncbi:MAG: hypothetical protein Q9187_007039 [Circinaria calcarea]
MKVIHLKSITQISITALLAVPLLLREQKSALGTQAIYDIVDSCLKRIDGEVKVLGREDEELGRAKDIQLEEISKKENPDRMLLLYGVAGSGITRPLEYYLHKNWGIISSRVTGKAGTPAKWLRFQKSCSTTFDPFESVFRLLLLITGDSMHPTFLDHFKPYNIRDLFREHAFYLCINESQCYLDTIVPGSSHSEDNNLFRLISEDILIWHRYQIRNLRFIVYGTSLKLKKTTPVIEKTIQFRKPECKPTPTKCISVTDFLLLTSGEQLKNLMEERGLLEKIGSHLDHVKKCGFPLQGRYLWSALYSRRLEDSELDHLDKNTTSNAAEKTLKEASCLEAEADAASEGAIQ